jgi:hypothetical protein
MRRMLTTSLAVAWAAAVIRAASTRIRQVIKGKRGYRAKQLFRIVLYHVVPSMGCPLQVIGPVATST